MKEEAISIQQTEGVNLSNPGNIIYVNQNATGNNNGSSWGDAYSDLQTALGSAEAEDKIWVAAGTYYPTDDGDRDQSFTIKTGIEVYGGFAGGETDLAQRDIIANPTVLSGNIGNRNDRLDNSYHVVDISETSFFTVVDGFTIIDGQADEPFRENDSGGGIYASEDGNADLRNLIIANNIADYGGGVYLEFSDYNLTNVALFNNNATINGGGLYSFASTGEIDNSLFVNNRSADGGAIAADFGNRVVGGVDIANSTFVNNKADDASVVLASFIPSDSEGISLENSIVSENPAGDDLLFNVQNDNITINQSIVQGGFDGSGEGIIDADPLFVDPENNNYSLSADSPGIDAGDNTAIAGIENDLVGNARITNGTVDVGSYEVQVETTENSGVRFIQQTEGININNPGNIIYVNQNASGNNNGSSWGDAYTDLQTALGSAEAEDKIWVAAGTYYPTDDGDREQSFTIKTGIEVYGGFAGSETDLAQRDIISNPTVLSGNIGNRNDRLDNSHHVVDISETSFFTVVDGFTIIDGQADEPFRENDSGGGIYASEDGNADLRNLIIANNIADYGGGVYLEFSDYNLTNVALFNNNATINGGGLYSFASTGEIDNSLFVNNRSADGGAIAADFGNRVVGGVDIANSTFVNNKADDASVVLASFIPSDSEGISLENSIVSENPAGNDLLFNVQNDNITINQSIVQGGFDGSGEGIIDADPLFVDPENNNYSLSAESPGIDAGDNNAIAGIENDLVGNARITNDTVDLGAYEFVITDEDINSEPNPPQDNAQNPPGSANGNTNNEPNPPQDNSQTPPGSANGDDLEGKPVYRFFIPDKGVHFYTADESEKDDVLNNQPNYVFEGAAYNSAPADDSLAGVDPVYRFLNKDTGVRLYTIAEKERDFIQENLPTYELEGIAYYAYTEPTENTTPVFRFLNPATNTHFYTPSEKERDNVIENLPNYQLEGNDGIAFHVELSDTASMPVAEPVPAPSANPNPAPNPDPVAVNDLGADPQAAGNYGAVLNNLFTLGMI